MGVDKATEKATGNQMSRNTKIVAITAAALILAMTALAWLNYSYVAERKAVTESGTFLITAGDDQYTVTMDDLMEIGLSVISANYKTYLMPAVQKQYTGVSLKSVFDYFSVDCSGAKSVSFSAADGYASAAPISHARPRA